MTLQMNGGYRSPQVLLLGNTLDMYYMDISLNKMIGTKWVLNATLSDVFNTKRMGTHYETPYYIQDMSRRRVQRFFRFSVTRISAKWMLPFSRKENKCATRIINKADRTDWILENKMQNKINIEGIELYANHGCLDEEAKIGGHYTVDVYMLTYFLKPLNRTISAKPLIIAAFTTSAKPKWPSAAR